LADAQRAGAPTLNFGLFINAIIQFLIVSFAVFWVVKALTRLHVRQDAVAAPTKSEVLLGEIRDLLAVRSSAVTGDAPLPASSNPVD
jgi:large conductance mechanosensitive channel